MKRIHDLRGKKRIAVSGAPGLGKAKLAERVAGVTCLPILPEKAREMMEKSNYDWRNKRQYIGLFEEAIFYPHLFYVVTHAEFVAHRSAYDVLAYSEYHLHHSRVDIADRAKLERLIEISQGKQYLYDCILFFRTDKTSATITEIQKCIDRYIYKALSPFQKSGKVMQVSSGDKLILDGGEIII